MSKYKVCKHTYHYDKLIKALDDHHIDYKTKDCIKKCSKCREKLLVQKGDKYTSAKTLKKLFSKLDIDFVE